MKRIVSLFLVLTLLTLSTGVLSSCGNDTPPNDTVTRMTVDINPSIEFMVDDHNLVVSVTAQNDDGAVLIVGEEFVGLTAEDAAKKVVSLAIDTGYITAGANVSADENTVKISVSGKSQYAKNLKEKTKKSITAYLNDAGVSARVEEATAMTLSELRKLATETGLCTAEEAEGMSENDLCKIIAAGRIETALLLTEDLRSVYQSAKAYKISLVEREETTKIIQNLGAIYSITLAGYQTALSTYSTLINSIDELRYNLLVDSASPYQQKLAELREKKADVLQERTYVATLDVGGTEYAQASLTLQADEEAYDTALSQLETIASQVNEQIEALITSLRSAEQVLVSLEQSFPKTITDTLTANAAALEEKINSAKDSFFAEFESAHSDDIAAAKEALLAQKEVLIASAKGEKE